MLFLLNILKGLSLFTGSYSINVFKEPLSSSEEEECINKMLLGDKESRCKLIEHNLRLVAHIVKKFNPKDIDTDDLISIGTIGLIKGIDTYKPGKGVKITTYAARCIQNEILMYYRSSKKTSKDVYLSDSIGYDKEGNEINLIDVIKKQDTDTLDEIYTKDQIEKLNKYIDILNEREREILEYRYGLNNKEELTQKELSSILNISRSYVSRIEKRALTKLLKEFMKDNN